MNNIGTFKSTVLLFIYSHLLTAVPVVFFLLVCNVASSQSTIYVCQGESTYAVDTGEHKAFYFYNLGKQISIGDYIISTNQIDSICVSKPAFTDSIIGSRCNLAIEKRAYILDISSNNNENETETRNVYSAEYMLEIAGISYSVTTSLTEALSKSDMIILSSELNGGSFELKQLDSIESWVQSGGMLVTPAITLVNNDTQTAEKARRLFGIKESNRRKDRYRVVWNKEHINEKELEYMDEPEELEWSVGRGKKHTGESIKTYGYTVDSSIVDILATFDQSDTVAVIRRELGNGTIYSFGMLWRDIIQRPQLNKDFEAQRITSNAFEPSADMAPFFLRSAYAKSRDGVSVWKYTLPDGYESLIIPTHDCDSRTAYDSLFYLSEYENSIGVKAHYFCTVHYFRDQGYMSAFYDDNAIIQLRHVLSDGHTIGSHSICHFPDFNKTDRFSMDSVGVEEYATIAHHDKEGGITTGGSTWAEVVLSKRILEKDLGNSVRSFRSGHLCMNKDIPLAEQMAGFEFASCYYAGNMLSEFPFRERIGNAWDGDFNGVLEMPLVLSDVFNNNPINENNWPEKAEMWDTVVNKLRGNYAPTILLIHPNRKWKMEVEKKLFEITDLSRTGVYNFEDYGDFWNIRRDIDFDYAFDSESSILEIHLTNDTQKESLKHVCFGVDLKDNIPVPRSIRLVNSEGIIIATGISKQLTPTRILALFGN